MLPRVASFLNLDVQPIESFSVMVGNGAYLHYSGYCPAMPFSVCQYNVEIPFYLLPIQGADLVLGIQWLETISPFVSDYTVPLMQFHYQGSLITLKGTSNPPYHLPLFIN